MPNPPTIQDVAGALGMHKSTVSLALSGKGNLSALTRQRVLSTARELGYEPNPLAQRLATGHRNALVCLFSGVLDVGLATEKLLLIQRELGAHGLEVPLYTCYEPSGDGARAQWTQIRQLCRQRPRAIICASQMVDASVYPELDSYQRGGGILVSYDLPTPLSCDQVIFDREDNAYQAARYLLSRGHRKIGVGMSNQTGPLSQTEGDPQFWRLRGFRRAFAEFGVAMKDEWLFSRGNYEKGGAEIARQFLALPDRPTAMCIVNDYVALAFVVEVMRAGVRIPHDLSVVSHDDQPIASYCPVPLTCITQPTDEIARTVAQRLLERLHSDKTGDKSGESDTPPAPRTITLRGHLVERASVADA